MIDLHCHSYFSDGSLSPEALVDRALSQGLSCLSITDHDTVSAYEHLDKLAFERPIKIIKGIELSVRWKKHDLHILGHQLQTNADLTALIERQTQSRIGRAQEIGQALLKLGIEEAYQKASDLAGHTQVGRLHFARLLVQEGRAKDLQAAFKQFLGRGKPAYVPSSWASLEEAIAVILQSKGRASIAHPLKYGLTRSKLHELIGVFQEAGGEGIEVVSGEMSMPQIQEMAALSQRFNLLASSGSDFHGDSLSRIPLGRQQRLPSHCKPIWHDWNIE